MHTLSTYGNQTLPSDANVSDGFDKDKEALITAIQNLSKMIQYGTGASTGSLGTPGIRIRTDGTSASSLGINIGGSSWMYFTASSVV